jgi:plastocyanin
VLKTRARVLQVGTLLAACVAVVALSGATAAPAQPPRKAVKPVTVTVNDFYFGPSSVTIHKGRSIRWTWSELNTYPHDVHLRKGPRGVSKSLYSTRTTAVTDAHFQRRFTTPGVYKFICTIHPTQMKLTVVVKR